MPLVRKHAGFSARLDSIGEAVMRRSMGVEETVKRGVKIILSAVLQQFVDQVGELFFPEGVFELAARFGEAYG